jgi:hypothetical protein
MLLTNRSRPSRSPSDNSILRLFPCLPCDLHGLVYSYLSWREKIFISVSKEIYYLSKSYREIRLNKPSSLQYALNEESFRDRVCSLVLPCHVTLRLRHREQISDAALTHLGNVGSLSLSCCIGFTDAGLSSLGNLKEIDLLGCRQLTDTGLLHLGNLQSLDLTGCRGFTDTGLAYLGNLEKINLSYCHLCHLGNLRSLKFTDAGLAYLGNLKKIDLSFSDQITDACLRHLGNLHLNLTCCRGITDAGLAYRKKINVSWCLQFTDTIKRTNKALKMLRYELEFDSDSESESEELNLWR